MADVNRVLQFRAGEAFRRIFKADARIILFFLALLHPFRALNGDAFDLVHVHVEDDIALQGRSRIVKMHNRLVHAFQRLERRFNQVFAALHQHLNRHVVGNAIFLNQQARKFIFDLRRRRKADFDFFEADFDQQFEQFQLFFDVHRNAQGLVAVAQIHAAPHRRGGDGVARPLAIRQVHRRKGTIAIKIHACHKICSFWRRQWRKSILIHRRRMFVLMICVTSDNIRA